MPVLVSHVCVRCQGAVATKWQPYAARTTSWGRGVPKGCLDRDERAALSDAVVFPLGAETCSLSSLLRFPRTRLDLSSSSSSCLVTVSSATKSSVTNDRATLCNQGVRGAPPSGYLENAQR